LGEPRNSLAKSATCLRRVTGPIEYSPQYAFFKELNILVGKAFFIITDNTFMSKKNALGLLSVKIKLRAFKAVTRVQGV